jgi:hypothetical protein
MIAAAHAKSTDPRRLHQARARAAHGMGGYPGETQVRLEPQFALAGAHGVMPQVGSTLLSGAYTPSPLIEAVHVISVGVLLSLKVTRSRILGPEAGGLFT